MARAKDIISQAALQALSRSTFGLALLCSACATLPHDRSAQALYIDAQKALNGESRLGWTVDRVEIEQAAAETEPSACRVRREVRADLLRFIEQRIQKQGGPAEAQFNRGRDIDELDDVLELERLHRLLENVEGHLAEDCPFWLKPEHEFEGYHSTSRRLVLIAESMGGASLLFTKGQVRAGGGGSARILVSYGFSPNLQWALGIEGGGDAVLDEGKEGTLSPAAAFRFGAPTWLRLIDVDRIYDVELAAVTRFAKGRLEPWGGRIAFGGGVTGLRRLGFMPALELWLGYELYPSQGGIPTQHTLSVGTRVGFDYDP
jgi:hypothetical protein